MVRLIASIIATIALIPGIVLLISPIPFGAIILVISLSTLICVNTTVQNAIKKLRRDHQSFNEKIYWLENTIGGRVKFISQSLIKTRPELYDHDGQEK